MITVALPLYDMKNIADLCYESLCNQITIIGWELIIFEEPHNAFGYPEEYIERLKKAGCTNVRYLSAQKRIPLSVKWRTIANLASGSGFVMCAGDNYYQPNLVQQSWYGLKVHDWFQSYRGLFYDFDSGRLVEYRLRGHTGLEMSMRMELARKIPYSYKKIGIDRFIYKNVKPTNPGWNEDESCLQTICTHGRNKISQKRGRMIRKVKPPFYKCDHELLNINKYLYEKAI